VCPDVCLYTYASTYMRVDTFFMCVHMFIEGESALGDAKCVPLSM